jgi:hypothetical protein
MAADGWDEWRAMRAAGFRTFVVYWAGLAALLGGCGVVAYPIGAWLRGREIEAWEVWFRIASGVFGLLFLPTFMSVCWWWMEWRYRRSHPSTDDGPR